MQPKYLFLLITALYSISSFSQTVAIPQVENGKNILYHIDKSTNNYFFNFTISPWGNWLFASKQFKSATNDYRDSVQLFLINAFDTSKSIWLLTLFPSTGGKCKVYVGNYTGSACESWGLFQEKVYFGVQGSTINTKEYLDSPFDYEIFSIDISNICSIKIPNFEYTPPPFVSTSFSKKSSVIPNRITSSTFPNPSQGRFKIEYSIPASNPSVICIYDTKGALIRVLSENDPRVGDHFIYWDGCTSEGKILPSGEYYYQIASGRLITSKKIILLK